MSWVLLNTLVWQGVCLALLAGAAELGEKNGCMGFGNSICPISRLFWHSQVELHLQSNAYEKFALQLPCNGGALFSGAV